MLLVDTIHSVSEFIKDKKLHIHTMDIMYMSCTREYWKYLDIGNGDF